MKTDRPTATVTASRVDRPLSFEDFYEAILAVSLASFVFPTGRRNGGKG